MRNITDNKKWFVIFLLVIALFAFLIVTRNAGAHGYTHYNWYPTVTPTPTGEVTPTPELCDGGDAEKIIQVCPTDEPTPTATPEATPTPEQSTGSLPTFAASTTEANNPSCDGNYPDKPLIQGFQVINETTDRYSWWPAPNADKQSVLFGYAPDQLTMGQDNLPKDQGTIDLQFLKPNTQTWMQVWAFRGECVTKSDIVN